MDTRESVVRLADYRAPAWRVDSVALEFDLDRDVTTVRSRLALVRDAADDAPLHLDGEDLELVSVTLDGRELPPERYRHAARGLTVHGAPGRCELETVVRVRPADNARLEGLYASRDLLITQCEAEGFRRITFFPDRPDVLATYRVTLRADRTRYPVLLANGNPVDAGVLDDGRHYAVWDDPFRKPSYLFALVAGPLGHVEGTHRTRDGRDVAVRVYAAPDEVPRCRHALDCALAAMRWDRERFGREYDLDVFNIVAAQDFTMGAMENKGLNIFNARYILADPDTATDADFEAVESVIGHEYFHNWSGNRVTVRDWFQLALKEGLTVFRDQEFTADVRSRAIKRIDDVRLLRSRQFPEDAGPLAHPVRPDSYREINNFYTATVYEKGAEIVRMLHTLLGEHDFRRGLDLYFERHDGGAATVEDFLGAMADACGRDLTQFARWYAQAGTPRIDVAEHWDAEAGRYRLDIAQSTAPTPGQPDKQPLLIPLAFALYVGGERHRGDVRGDAPVRGDMIELTRAQHRIEVDGLRAKPLPAFLQGLSAPVTLRFDYDAAQLGRLATVERDPLTRWDALQRIAIAAICAGGARAQQARAALLDAVAALLAERDGDPALLAECLLLPDFDTLSTACDPVDVDTLWRAREDLLDELAESHADALDDTYARMAAGDGGTLSAADTARRRLKNVALSLLTRLDPRATLAAAQFDAATTLTDRLAALRELVHVDAPDAGAALDAFRRLAGDDALLTDKWIALVASRPQPETLDAIAGLLASPHWQPRNPNRVRALLGTLARSNPVAFHRADGAGYALVLRETAAIDALNPQVAARLLTAFESWRRLDAGRRERIAAQLDALAAEPHSDDLADVLARLREP